MTTPTNPPTPSAHPYDCGFVVTGHIHNCDCGYTEPSQPAQPEPVKEQELKPCPFCGDRPVETNDGTADDYKYRHPLNECILDGLWFTKINWNRRTPPVQDEQRNGDWIDKFGACKICGGEIPYGHTGNCDVYKLEDEIQQLKERARKLVGLCKTLITVIRAESEYIHKGGKLEVVENLNFTANDADKILHSLNLDGEKGGEG